LNFTDENYIKKLLEKFKLRFNNTSLNRNSFQYIMSCLLFDNRIDYIEVNDFQYNFLDDKDINYDSENEFINSIISYLINGKYIIIYNIFYT
jgi:hypothetical protein